MAVKKARAEKKRNRLIPNVMAAIKLQEVILLINLCETKQQYPKSKKNSNEFYLRQISVC